MPFGESNLRDLPAGRQGSKNRFLASYNNLPTAGRLGMTKKILLYNKYLEKMRKIMLFILVWFSLTLFGCNSQTSNTDEKNLIEGISEEVVLEEVEANNTTKAQVEKPIEPVVNNISATESLAKCLTAKWAKMYGTETCPYCMKQKDLFGEDFKYVNYINCMEQPAVCGEANIQWVPAWGFKDGSQKAGLQSLKDLAAFAGCEY